MDEQLIASYRRMVLRFGVSAEDILEDPEHRNTFLVDVRQALGNHLPERQLLHRLSLLRKTGRLPRSRDLLASSPTQSVSVVPAE
jgi:hypothetical protein